MNDKLYIGGSFGVSIVNYQKHSIYRENDITGNKNNNFDYSTFDETSTTKGAGISAKLGIIFKPADMIRLGLALHSPVFYGLKDTYHSSMATHTENYVPGLVTVNSQLFTGDPLLIYKYNHVSPWKATLSGSYVIREIEDVTKQRGFISADIEYINYRSSSYQVTDQTTSGNDYYKGVNSTIHDIYKGNLNYRLGGELKFNTIMVRAGVSYYGSPYKEKELKAGRTYFSGGLGYRDQGMFIDLTYVYAMNKDVNFPYRLSDKANTFAAIKGTGGNALLTVGLKF
jgi:long-subunit fatty acid transport protein